MALVLALPAAALLAPTAASSAGVAMPAAASSAGVVPTLRVDRPCYVNAGRPAKIVISGTGWAPGGRVRITGAQAAVTATAGLTGSFKVSASAPKGSFRLRQTTKTLSATETDVLTGDAVPGMSAQADYLITALAYSVSPQDTPFTRKVTFRFSGFRAEREVFAHYLSGTRVVARERFGRTTGPCGLLRARTLQYPGGHPGSRTYTVQFDDAPRYSRHAAPRVVTRLSVIRY